MGSGFIYSLPSISRRGLLCEDASSLHAALLDSQIVFARTQYNGWTRDAFPATPLERVRYRVWGWRAAAPYLQRNAAREPFFSALSKDAVQKSERAHHFVLEQIEFHDTLISNLFRNIYISDYNNQ